MEGEASNGSPQTVPSLNMREWEREVAHGVGPSIKRMYSKGIVLTASQADAEWSHRGTPAQGQPATAA